MENNLPNTWVEISLTSDLDFLPTGVEDYKGQKEYYSTGSIKDDSMISEGQFNFTNRPSRANRVAKLGDVFQARMKNTDKGLLIDEKLDGQLFSTGFIQIRPNPDIIHSKYIYYYIKSNLFLEQRDELATGSTQEALTDNKAKEIRVPLAPLKEQKRIVEKLDALMARISNSKTRLEKIPTLLKNFRQSVLAAAVRGELTKEWRENNKDIQEAKTKIKKKERRNVLDDKVDDYDLYDLPIKWNWKTISDVSDVKGGKRVPKGHKLVSNDTGLPYIKAGDLKKGTVLKDKLEYLLPETQKLIKRYIVSKGDAYITNVGAKIGDAGIIPDDLDGANLTENALKMCNLEGVINLYLSIWLQSPIAQGFIQKTILSAAQGKLALGRVEVFPIPLPPIEEQEEIVRKVEELFHFADSIEARYQKAKAWFDKLPQAILAKAFRGELVPQNPTDEPASVLLERIEEEKKRVVDEKPKKRNRIPISKTKIIMASLIEIIKEAGGKIEPKELWEKSDFQKDIDAFYAALKEEIEKKKTIKQNADKTLSLS